MLPKVILGELALNLQLILCLDDSNIHNMDISHSLPKCLENPLKFEMLGKRGIMLASNSHHQLIDFIRKAMQLH